MINISKLIIEKEEIRAVLDVMKSGNIVQGKITEKLENEFAKYCDTKYAVAMNSGTAAIHSALYALGIGAGDEVITTPFTFVATANPILMQSAKVVFADINEDDFNIDPADIERKITKKTKAIIPVDLFGQIYNYNAIKKIAKKHNLKIIEDACQAVGAKIGHKMAGNFGDVSVFSLYATKNMMSGEGGILTTNDLTICEKAKSFRHHGQSEKVKYEYLDLGYNYRITDICASIGLAQLKKINKFNEKRIRNARILSHGLKKISGLITPKIKENHKHVFHQYTVRVTSDFGLSRDDLANHLKSVGIGCGVYYPKPLHLHRHFAHQGYKKGDFPISEKISNEVLSLPVHPSLKIQDINKIIREIKRCQNT